MARVLLGLGANLGDKKTSLCHALHALSLQVRLTAVSSLYDTAPVLVTDQPRFLNLACAAETTLQPLDLLRFVKQVERELGRTPTVRYGPRAIDIDILLYDDVVINLPELTIPHAHIRERAFVLAPLVEIAPDATVPGLGRTIAELWRDLPQQDVKRVAGEEGRLKECMK